MSHAYVQLDVHAVFSTKDRRPFLQNPTIQRRVHAYLAEAIRCQDCSVDLVGGTADHVHILMGITQNTQFAEIMKEAKRVTTIWIHKEFNELRDFYWQSGYGAFSVSYSNRGRVRAYIDNQIAHHARKSFQDEFRQLLRKHAIPYDESTIWS
jgi:putative transposase